MNTIKKTSISDDKIKEILIDGINSGASHVLNKTVFYEHVRTIHKVEKQRAIRLYDQMYPAIQRQRNELKSNLGAEEEVKNTSNKVKSRIEILEKLSSIINQDAVLINGVETVPTFADVARSIEIFNKMQGYNEPERIENYNTNTPFTQPVIHVTIDGKPKYLPVE